MFTDRHKKEAFKKGAQAYKDGLTMDNNYYLSLPFRYSVLAGFWDKGYINEKNKQKLKK
jgi:hypothetical protein